MARPTPAAVTTAGFAQVGATSQYVKTVGTAKAVIDVGTGASNTGVCGVFPAAPGVPISPSDWAAHVATFASFGLSVNGEAPCPGFQYYGQTV